MMSPDFTKSTQEIHEIRISLRPLFSFLSFH